MEVQGGMESERNGLRKGYEEERRKRVEEMERGKGTRGKMKMEEIRYRERGKGIEETEGGRKRERERVWEGAVRGESKRYLSPLSLPISHFHPHHPTLHSLFPQRYF